MLEGAIFLFVVDERSRIQRHIVVNDSKLGGGERKSPLLQRSVRPLRFPSLNLPGNKIQNCKVTTAVSRKTFCETLSNLQKVYHVAV